MVTGNALTAKYWYECGYKRKRASDITGSLDAFRQSLKLNPKVAAPWVGLAQLMDANNQLEEARQCLQQAAMVEPNNVMVRQLLASSHQALGYVEHAKREFENALKLEPNSALTYCGLGLLLEDIGEAKEAANAYRKSLLIDKFQNEALSHLLGLGRHVDISSEIEQAKTRLEHLSLKDKALVGYGLGKAYEQQKNYPAAFMAYKTANNARRENTEAFNRKIFDRRIETMMDIFSAEFFKARQGWGNKSERPVFIVGLPRSGTTLTEQILASHEQCFGAGELSVLTDLATGTPDRLDNAAISWPESAFNLSAQQVHDLGEDYLIASGQRAPEAVIRVVDKQPLNFWHLGLVALAFPNARIVHCTRDIRDCGLSIFTQNFNSTQRWSTDLDDIAYYWQGYQKLMAHFKQVSGLKILEVNYEKTVSKLECQSRRLLDFVGLPWDERVLNFHQSERTVQTPSRWQVRQPLYQSAKARWRNYESYLTPLINA
ncbi:MAG: sulfotransferase, partial [Gammaproteobacteria bacterium]|nr:sulfotransferase [Gammaproteobacteria bacterium]